MEGTRVGDPDHCHCYNTVVELIPVYNMYNKLLKSVLFSLLLVLMSGCSTWRKLNNTEKGGAVGGGSGILIGAAVGGPIGAVVGGAAGAFGGSVVGSEAH